MNHGAGERKSVLHAATKRRDERIPSPFQRNNLEERPFAFLELLPAKSVEPTEEVEVLTNPEVRVNCEVLRHVTNKGFDGGGTWFTVEHLGGPSIAPQKAAKYLDDRGLPGAVGANEAVYLSLVDGEVKFVDGEYLPIGLLQLLGDDSFRNLDHRRGNCGGDNISVVVCSGLVRSGCHRSIPHENHYILSLS